MGWGVGGEGRGVARTGRGTWPRVRALAWAGALAALVACGTPADGTDTDGREDTPPMKTDGSPPQQLEPPGQPEHPTPEACVPVSCQGQGASCGGIPDGCGGTLNCGTCAEGQQCGLHAPHQCGTPACEPKTCADVGAQCGAMDDGCGGTLQCGGCDLGMTCGGGGQAHVCGTPNYGTQTACTQDGVCILNPGPVAEDLKDVWGRSAQDFWAVGDGGYLVHGGKNGLTVLPSGADLSGVWGSAPEDVWAVGSKVLHFDGRTWSEALKPSGFLLDVYGADARHVWAVGAGGLAYAWNGAKWTRQSTGTTEDLYGVWTDGTVVWAVGTHSTVRRRDARGWHTVVAPEEGITFTGVWGSGPEDVWLTGVKNGAKVFHWNGRAWTAVSLPFPALYGIAGASARDLLVVGEGGAAHYDGSTWFTSLSVADTRLLGAWMAPDGGLAVGAAGRVWRQVPHSPWTPLDTGSRADFVAMWMPQESGAWWFADGSRVTLGYYVADVGERGPANALASNAPGSLWAVGDLGRADFHTWEAHGSGTNYYHLPGGFRFLGVHPFQSWGAWLVGTDTDTHESLLVSLDGASSAWVRHPVLVPGALHAIHGSADDDVWAVGDSVLAHWDGSVWTETHGALLPSFRAVWVQGPGLAWALSPTQLWRWDGMRWAPLSLPADVAAPELRALFVYSPEELYVAGDGGLLLRYDSTRGEWRRLETGTRKHLRALSGGPTSVIAAGEDGTVLRLYR